MKILDVLRAATETLEKAGLDDALADAELLTWHAADIDRLTAFLDNPEISPHTLAKIRRLTARRVKGEPVQYIVGHVEFCGLKITVGKGVLIPRPETELLVEEAIKTVPCTSHSSLSVLDLCTGSGCIALALAKKFPRATIIGTDISLKALYYARKNAPVNKITNITFMKGSLFGPVKRGGKFDLITANPPYIINSEISELQSEVKDWEPASALDGGSDGLDFYREILSKSVLYLKSNGSLIMELGYDQADSVSKIAEQNGFPDIEIIDDFAGIARIMKARKRQDV